MVYLMMILRYLEEVEESKSTCIHTAFGMPWEDCILLNVQSCLFHLAELDRHREEGGSSKTREW